MTGYIDRLSEFGESFQNKIIYSLIHDIEFLQSIYDTIEVDYFESDDHQWIVQKILEYYDEYKKNITMEVFSIAVKNISADSFKESVKTTLQKIYTEKKLDDLDFVKDQFQTFCKNQKLKSAILKSAELLKRGKYDEIKVLVDDAMKAGMSKEIGHNWIDDVNIRLQDLRNPAATHMAAIDNITDGGLGPGEIGVVAAPSGVGKTWVLCQLGFNAAKHGDSVLHITLELPEQYVSRRYDTILTGKPFTVLKENPEHLIKGLEQIKKAGGNVDVREFPTRGITTAGLEGFIEKVMQLKKIDLIILDYADLLGRGKNASGDDYSDMGGIYEELRGISQKIGVPIWTATQTNRSALESDVIGADGIADSYKKVMTADFIMSIIRKDVDKMNDRARAHIIKNRFGPDGMTFDCKMDTTAGKFHIFDTKVDNSKIEKKQDDYERSQIKKKYEKFKSNDKPYVPTNDFG